MNINLPKEKQKLRKLRKDVWIRYNGNQFEAPCYVCTKMVDAHSFEAGHIVSLHNGGLTELENLRPLCKVCNRSMSARNMDEFVINYGYDSRLLRERIPKYKGTNQADAFSRFTKIPITLHNQIWRQYNGSAFFSPCYVCNGTVNALNYAVHTVVSPKNGGRIEIANLRPVCKTCKSSVGQRNMKDYMRDHSLNSRLLGKAQPRDRRVDDRKISKQMSAFLRKVKSDKRIYKGTFRIDDVVPILSAWNKQK